MSSESRTPRLREDADPYCTLWVGILFFAAYYFNFFYNQFLQADFIASLGGRFLSLIIIPVLLVFLFIGYFRPKRKKLRINMLALAIFLSALYLVISYPVGGVFLTTWGIGSAIVVALGFSMRHSYDQATTLGIMDVSALHYGPKPAPEPEPEPEKKPKTETVPSAGDQSEESTS